MYVFKKNNISKCYTIEEDLNFKEKEIGGFRIFKLNKISNHMLSINYPTISRIFLSLGLKNHFAN